MKSHSSIVKKIILTSFVFALIAGCASCSPGKTQVTSEQEAAELASEQTNWSTESDCSMCHSAQAASFEDSTLTASAHQGSNCINCHSDETALKETHANAFEAPAKPSRNSYTMASMDTCLGACHISYEELADETSESVSLKDLNSLIVNPHAVPDSSGHGADSKECYNCHTIHSEQVPDGQYCQECHHTNYFGSCSQCHE